MQFYDSNNLSKSHYAQLIGCALSPSTFHSYLQLNECKHTTMDPIEERRYKNAMRMRRLRENQSEEEAARRRMLNAIRMQNSRLNMTEDVAAEHRRRNALRMREYRLRESLSKMEERKCKNTERMRKMRQNNANNLDGYDNYTMLEQLRQDNMQDVVIECEVNVVDS